MHHRLHSDLLITVC